MDLRPYVEEIQRQLETAADAGGDDARALASRLLAPLDAAIRLSLLEALSAAAQEITCDLAPGSVEVRLRGREPEFVVTTPAEPPGTAAGGTGVPPTSGRWPAAPWSEGWVGTTARWHASTFVCPSTSKGASITAAAEGLSVNTWLVRAAGAALERVDASRRPERPGPHGPQRFTGWAR